MDFMYLGILAVAFGAEPRVAQMCEWLFHDKYGEHS